MSDMISIKITKDRRAQIEQLRIAESQRRSRMLEVQELVDEILAAGIWIVEAHDDASE